MNREILRLAIPNIISNISVPLLSALDLILMGDQGKETPVLIGAVAIGAAVFNMVYWGFAFLRMGTTGLTAQAFGAKDNTQISQLLGQGVIVALFSAITLLLLQVPLSQFSFWILGTAPHTETYQFAQAYFFIRIWAAPAVFLQYAISGWFFGMQNAKYPMLMILSINIANIFFKLLFVFFFDMGIQGIALGTVLAQYTGLSLAILLFVRKYKNYALQLSQVFVFELSAFKHFFAVNGDIFIRTICLIITYTYFTRASTMAGETLLSANTILLQMFYIASYSVDGFGYAAESLAGKYVGEKNSVLLKKSIHLCLMWGVALASLFALIYGFAGTQIISLFTKHTNVIQQAETYIVWAIIAVLVGAPAFVWDGIYIGATASVAMRNNMLAATFLCFFPLYFLLQPYCQNHALWLALIGYMLARNIGLGLLANKKIYNLAE